MSVHVPWVRIRFEKPLLYWDFNRHFADICFRAHQQTEELAANMRRIAGPETFPLYTALYEGQLYGAESIMTGGSDVVPAERLRDQ